MLRYTHAHQLDVALTHLWAHLLHVATLDAMASTKLNVLMWHIVDGNSFPLRLDGYEELADKASGADVESHDYRIFLVYIHTTTTTTHRLTHRRPLFPSSPCRVRSAAHVCILQRTFTRSLSTLVFVGFASNRKSTCRDTRGFSTEGNERNRCEMPTVWKFLHQNTLFGTLACRPSVF